MNQSENLQGHSKVINKWTIGSGLTGLSIILLSVILGIFLEDAQEDSEFFKRHAHPIIVFIEFFTHIGIALCIAALFSFAIEFKDFTEYVERLLTRIVRDQKYLSKLSNEERINLRRDIDLVTLRAESNFGKAGDFYKFLTDIFDDIVKSSYRKEHYEDYIYYVDNKNHLSRERTMRYSLVKGFQSNNLKITWQWGGKIPKSDQFGIYEFIKKISLSIKIKSKNIYENYNYCAAKKKLMPNKEHSDRMPDNITVTDEQIEGYIYIKFSFDIPDTNNLHPDDYIDVIIIDDLEVIPDDDPIVVSRMAYPTYKPSFRFIFPENYLIHTLRPFKIHKGSKGYEEKEIKNGITILFDEWLLPGHGVAVYWKIANNNPAR